VSGRRALAPVDYFYWHRSHHADRHTPFIFPATTSGMAGGFTRGEALEAALREYVERDAFLAWWLTGKSPARIVFDEPYSPRLALVFEEAARCGIEIHFLDLTRDTGVPVAACVLISRRGGEPLLTVGASAKDDQEQALISAYEEALSVMASDGVSDDASVAFDQAGYLPFERQDIGLKERSVFYRGEARLELARFFYTGISIPYRDFAQRFHDAPRGPQSMIDHLRGRGCRIYVHYPGHRALRRLGYHTVAVCIPELLPMYLNETDAPLGHQRLAQLLADAQREAPYPYPHPFP
jgi:ribosomal protein S12 methylthiotransferase accessory factor